MLKPDSLRAALTEALVDADGVKLLERDPDKLRIFIDQGRIAAHYGGGVGFEWRYRLNAILTDFAGDVDVVALAVICWVARYQPELLQNHNSAAEAVKFEADVIDATTIDLSLELELNEAVVSRPRAGGGFDLVHLAEPDPTPPFDGVPDDTRLAQFFIGDSLVLGGE